MDNWLSILGEFNLFIDLDDVLISSHNDMNSDLAKRYPKLDWKYSVPLAKQVEDSLRELKGIQNMRAQEAYLAFIELRQRVQTYGMEYRLMSKEFDRIDDTFKDSYYSDEENEQFHRIIRTIKENFIARERFLDLRDTQLYRDNLISDGSHAVRYENYYTRTRLEGSSLDSPKPAVVARMVKDNLFKGHIKVLSHLNGKNEEKAKQEFIDDCYPNTELVPVYFHEDNNYNPEFRRPRYAKAKFVKESLKEDITKSILIDDSIENISNWVMNGGIGILYDVNNRFKSNDDYYVIHSFDYDEIMNVMYQIAEKENKKRGKVYQL